MDFELPPEAEDYRAEIKAWLAEHPHPSATDLAAAGLVAPHWPRPYGLAAGPIQQLVIDEELRAVGVQRPINPIGIGWAGPTILHAGSEEQQARYLPPMLRAEEIWCQLFSEPNAGSDLASLQTRAVRDGDEYVVNGQKIWTSLGHFSHFGILLARTDPAAPKHKGISYFICPMKAPGVEVRPLIQMTAEHSFNEVFLTDVRIPAENLVGRENDGWRLAKVTLGNERVSLSGAGALWGEGPTADDLVAAAHGEGDTVMRQRLAAIKAEGEILRLIRLRTLTAQIQGRQPGPEASIRKALADEHGQHIMGAAKDRKGAAGLLHDQGDQWDRGYLFAPALTIGGGTSEVQRNIIGERILGLPHEPVI